MEINSISFKAIHLSTGNIKNNRLDVYKLTDKDSKLLEYLGHTISLKALTPNNDLEYRVVHHYIIQNALQAALKESKESFLITSNDKPCGILVSTKEPKSTFVNYVAT